MEGCNLYQGRMVDAALGRLDAFDIAIFVSANAVEFGLDVPKRGHRPVGVHDATLQAAVMILEAIQQEGLDAALVGRGPQRALGVGPLQLRFLVGEPLAQSLLRPLTPADGLELFVVPLEIDVALQKDLLDLADLMEGARVRSRRSGISRCPGMGTACSRADKAHRIDDEEHSR